MPGEAWLGLTTAKRASLHLTFGRGFMAIGAPADALDALDRCLALAPALAAAHLDRGNALALLGDYARAKLALRRASELTAKGDEASARAIDRASREVDRKLLYARRLNQ